MKVNKWQVLTSLALVAVAMTAIVSTVHAGRFVKGGGEGPLRLRYFTAEIPPASDGGMVRLGVRLPLSAKIAKTEVFVDSTDKGAAKDWSKCDIEDKTCEIGGASIVGFHREDQTRWQELAVDIRSDAERARYAKISVLFQPQTGFDDSGCSRNNIRCGYAASLD